MIKIRKLFSLLFILGIGFSLFYSNTTVYAENELPGIGVHNFSSSEN